MQAVVPGDNQQHKMKEAHDWHQCLGFRQGRTFPCLTSISHS